jgi:hypothetical protein
MCCNEVLIHDTSVPFPQPIIMIANRLRHLGSRRVFRCFSSETDLLASILEKVREGRLQPSEAETLIKNGAESTPEAILKSFANLDHSRSSRTGFPEAVFAAGKTPDQVACILDDMARNLNEQILNGDIDDVQRAILATR